MEPGQSFLAEIQDLYLEPSRIDQIAATLTIPAGWNQAKAFWLDYQPEIQDLYPKPSRVDQIAATLTIPATLAPFNAMLVGSCFKGCFDRVSCSSLYFLEGDGDCVQERLLNETVKLMHLFKKVPWEMQVRWLHVYEKHAAVDTICFVTFDLLQVEMFWLARFFPSIFQNTCSLFMWQRSTLAVQCLFYLLSKRIKS